MAKMNEFTALCQIRTGGLRISTTECSHTEYETDVITDYTKKARLM